MAYKHIYKDDVLYLGGDPNNPQQGDALFKWDGTQFVPMEYSVDCCEPIPTGIKLSRGSVTVGEQLGMSDFGSNVGFKIKRDLGTAYLPPVLGVTQAGVSFPLGVAHPEGAMSKVVFFDGTDNVDAVLDSGKYKIAVVASSAGAGFAFIYNQYLTCGTTAPTSPVTFKIYEASDDTDPNKLMIKTILPVSLWDSKSSGDEIKFNFSENQTEELPITARSDVSFYLEYSSNAPFSLYADGTDLNRAVDSQAVSLMFASYDSYLEIDSDHTHDRSRTYVVDTTDDEVEITIPFGTVNSLIVLDAEKKFKKNSCFVLIKDAGGATAHTLELDKKDRGYKIYFNGTNWIYNEIGKGECIAVASYHKASVDFKGDDSTEFHLESATDPISINSDGVTYSKIPGLSACGAVGFTCSAGSLYCTDGGRFSFTGASDAKVGKADTIFYTLFIDDEPQAQSSKHTFGASSKTESLVITGVIELTAGQKLEVWARGSGATGQTLTVESLNMVFLTRN